MIAARAAASRLDPVSRRGHYESWFVRANPFPADAAGSPAIWLRYTSFVPRGVTAQAGRGELWAIVFDVAPARHVAVRSDVPLGDCSFSPSGLGVRIGDASLDARHLRGSASSGGHRVAWDLQIAGGGSPMLLLPARLYEAPVPRAKALVVAPLVRLTGFVEVDERRRPIDGWLGSVNHNWGSEHTARYAWGQVAGFDDAPDVLLECATARVRVGPVLTPALTTIAVRDGAETIELTSVASAIRARGAYEVGAWSLRAAGPAVRVEASFAAPRSAFVGLTYANPPGGVKTCLNSKIASSELTLWREGRPPLRATSRGRAAFEILTDDTPAGIPVLV